MCRSIDISVYIVLALAIACASTNAFAEEMQSVVGEGDVQEKVEQKVDAVEDLSSGETVTDDIDTTVNEGLDSVRVVQDRSLAVDGGTKATTTTTLDTVNNNVLATPTNVWAYQFAPAVLPGLTYNKWFMTETYSLENGRSGTTILGYAKNASDKASEANSGVQYALTELSIMQSGISGLRSDVDYIKNNMSGGSASGTVAIDTTQYNFIRDSMKTLNTLVLVSFLMVCANVGVLLAGRFLGGVNRG